MTKTQLRFLAVLLSGLIVLVLFAGLDDLPRKLRAEIATEQKNFATSEKVPLTWATSVGVLAHQSALLVYGGLRGSTIRRSTDGGQSWTTVYQGFSGSKSGEMDGMARGDQVLFGIANGCSVPACAGAVLRSADGGMG